MAGAEAVEEEEDGGLAAGAGQEEGHHQDHLHTGHQVVIDIQKQVHMVDGPQGFTTFYF